MVTWSEENRGNKRPWTINFTITPLRKTSFPKRQGSLSRKKLNKTKKKKTVTKDNMARSPRKDDSRNLISSFHLTLQLGLQT